LKYYSLILSICLIHSDLMVYELNKILINLSFQPNGKHCLIVQYENF